MTIESPGARRPGHGLRIAAAVVATLGLGVAALSGVALIQSSNAGSCEGLEGIGCAILMAFILIVLGVTAVVVLVLLLASFVAAVRAKRPQPPPPNAPSLERAVPQGGRDLVADVDRHALHERERARHGRLRARDVRELGRGELGQGLPAEDEGPAHGQAPNGQSASAAEMFAQEPTLVRHWSAEYGQ